MPPKRKLKPPKKHRLVELFWTLAPAYTRWAEKQIAEKGTTPHRLRLIGLLCRQGPMTMSQLRDELGVTATNITALIDALEKNKRVVRKPNPADRRSTIIEVTPETKRLFALASVEFKDRIGDLFLVFSEKEQKTLLDLLERMKGALVERGILTSTS
jgi:DNA-binding MarR family transcriptional regulator